MLQSNWFILHHDRSRTGRGNTAILFDKIAPRGETMGVKKVSHLDEHELLENDREKRVELLLADGKGRIISYHPFNSMQIIFYDIYLPELPDLWKLGFRRGDGGRYLRTLICKHGSCEFTVNGKKNILPAGQVMMDYSVGDDRGFDSAAINRHGTVHFLYVSLYGISCSLLQILMNYFVRFDS